MCACLLARSVFCFTCFTSHFLSSFISSFRLLLLSSFSFCFFAMCLTKYPWSLPYAYTRLLHLYVSIWIRIRRSSGEKIFFDLPTCRERQSSIRQISLLAVILHVKIPRVERIIIVQVRAIEKIKTDISNPSASRLNVLTKIV